MKPHTDLAMSPSPRSLLTILLLLLLGCHCVTSLDRCLPQHHLPRDNEATAVNGLGEISQCLE